MDDAHRAASARAVHVYTADGRWLRAGRATLFILERTTPFSRLLARIGRVPPLIWFVEIGYWLVARNRGLVAKVVLPRRK